MFVSGSRVKSRSIHVAALICCFAGSLTPAVALDDTDHEKEGRKACEAKLCRIILDRPKEPKGLLTCKIGKTWGKAKIEEGAESKNIEWSFGDARCKVELKIPHSAIAKALTNPKFTFSAAPHTVDCDVETGGGIKPVRAVFEPKLKFEGGRVKKAWVGLRKIDGPPLLKGLVWTTAKLEDALGIFHSEMVKEINEFIHETCAEEHGPDADKKKNKKAKKGEEAKKNAQSGKKSAEASRDDKDGGAQSAKKAADVKPSASKGESKPSPAATKPPQSESTSGSSPKSAPKVSPP